MLFNGQTVGKCSLSAPSEIQKQPDTCCPNTCSHLHLLPGHEFTCVSMSCRHTFSFLSISMVTSIPEHLSSRLLCCDWMASLQSCSCCFSNLSKQKSNWRQAGFRNPIGRFWFFSLFVSLQVSDVAEQGHHLDHIKEVVTMVAHADTQHRTSYLFRLRVLCLQTFGGKRCMMGNVSV